MGLKPSLLKLITPYLAAQIVISVLLAAVIGLKSGRLAALSVLIVALICIVTYVLFAAMVNNLWRAQDAKRFVFWFTIGECLKLGIQGFLIVLVIKYLPVVNWCVLVSYGVNLMIMWMAPFVQFGLIERKG